MQWRGRRGSSNVDDRRGSSGGGIAAGGGIAGVIIYLIYTFLSGGNVDPSQIPQIGEPSTQSAPLSAEEKAADDERAEFVKVVLADTEDIWNKIYADQGQSYSEPTLVLFRDYVQSGCGNASAASGPFYCPGDSKLYIDLSFYQDLQNKKNLLPLICR